MSRRRLGKKVDRKERTKAIPANYPDEGPCGLADAYEQLTRGAFAIWIRMSVAGRDELSMGRGRLSQLLGYSRRQGDELLAELDRKGFVAFVPHGPWRRTVVVVVRKPLLERGHGFTRFASILYSQVSEMHFRQQRGGKSVVLESSEIVTENSFEENPGSNNCPVENCFSEKSTTENKPNSHVSIAPFRQLPASFRYLPKLFRYLPYSPTTYQMHPGSVRKSLDLEPSPRTETRGNMAVSTQREKRHKFVTEDGYFPSSVAYIDHRDLINSSKRDELERRRLLRSSNHARRLSRNAENRARGIDVLDWNDLDIVTFDPRRSKHRAMRTVLARKLRDPDRTALVKRLETEFCRLYTRYRRAAERAGGRAVITYEVSAKERTYAATAAVLCVQRGVTPRQLMEFWHENIKHFRRAASMKVPTLAFLSGAANIDTVACGLVLDETAPGGSRIGTNDSDLNGSRPSGGNSFSDTTRLDPRMRSGLEQAGFSTRELNDRYLLTVQKNALGISGGRDIFIGKGPLRDMSLWAAKNLYAK